MQKHGKKWRDDIEIHVTAIMWHMLSEKQQTPMGNKWLVVLGGGFTRVVLGVRSGVTRKGHGSQLMFSTTTLLLALLFSYLILGLEWGSGKKRRRTKQQSEKQSILKTFKHDMAFFRVFFVQIHMILMLWLYMIALQLSRIFTWVCVCVYVQPDKSKPCNVDVIKQKGKEK